MLTFNGGWKWLWLPLTILSIGAAVLGFIAHELFLSNAFPLVSLFYPLVNVNVNVNVQLALLMTSSTAAAAIHAIHAKLFTPTFWQIEGQPFIQLFSLLMIFTALPIIKCNHSSKLKISITNHLANWNNYNGQIIENCQTFSLMVSRYWDRGLIEFLGPLGLLRLFHYATFKLELATTGFLSHYSLFLQLLALLIILQSTPRNTSKHLEIVNTSKLIISSFHHFSSTFSLHQLQSLFC